MGAHINADGKFQSDKYPTCPAGKVPLSVNDVTAQDLLWEYAQRRRAVDGEFSDDLETALDAAGHSAERERRIEANANLTLWCVHVTGADDIYAEPTHAAAVIKSAELNRVIYSRPASGADEVMCFAYADVWPWSPEEHAKSMADEAEQELARTAALAASK